MPMSNDHEKDELAQSEGAGQEMTSEEPRIGVYICHCGGNISDVVDVKLVAREAKKLPGVVVSRDDVFMCSDPGQNLILEDIREHGLNRVVVASCSPSLHETTFRAVLSRAGTSPYLYEHANVREQVSWVMHDREKATQKALTLVRAAVAKADLLEPLNPIRVDTHGRVLVIGGGVSGMRAALDLADRDLKVDLVEKEGELGGFVRTLGPLFPDGGIGSEIADHFIQRVESHPLIQIHLATEVVASKGYVGNFTITLAKRGNGDGSDEASRETSQTEVGAIVVASGFQAYVPPKREFGYQRIPEVLTMPDFLSALDAVADSAKTLEIGGRAIRHIGFMHCVGSRQISGVHDKAGGGKINEHCSRVCCTTTLYTIGRLQERFPGIATYDFYQDIRAYGRGHEELYDQASRGGALFFRYLGAEPPKVVKAGKGDDCALTVTTKDQLTWGEEIEVGLDLLVLAVGMVPADIGTVIDALKLAVSDDRFLQEVHPKLRPVEQATAGILLAGVAQSPKDVTESVASASAAAVKAASILSRGYVELDPYVANIDPEKCEGHGLCVEECSYEGAIRLVKHGDGQRAQINPAICSGCGCCVAVCPTRAIDINGWTLDQFDAMVDAILADQEVKLP